MPDFQSFLRHCQTHDPGHDTPRAIPDWSYIHELAKTLEVRNRVLVVKSRQMMVTWIGCAWLLHRAVTGGPGQHLVLSKEERSARELIDRIRFLYDHLPPSRTSEKIRVKAEGIVFPERNTQILSLPTTPHAVRGRSPRTVFWDEMAFTPYDEEVWTAVKPAVDSGGSFLGVSTPNGPAGVFARLVHDRNSHFFKVRLHYSQNPEKGSKWQESARSGLSEARWRREQELSFEGAEGRVYDQFEVSAHVVKRTALPGSRRGVRLYRGVDFGYRRPAVVWVEEDARGQLTVFDCIVGDRWPIPFLLDRIARVDARYGLRERDFSHTAVDPAGAANNDFGISPVEAFQQASIKTVHRSSSISPGIEAVRALLRDANGEVGLRVHKRCAPLITAFQAYAWDASGESPDKDGEHDHLMDALRYLVINLPRYQRTPFPATARVAGIDSRTRR
jgi:hypothetical protein